MAKITQYSRISHHTIYGLTGSTFSIPQSEDFTDGTWTIYDLALSEIGVNETDKKAYMRIDDEVKEFAWSKSEISGSTNSIIMSDGSGYLYNSNVVLKQIAITVSGDEIYDLYNTPKVLVAKDGSSKVHEVISAYVRVNVGTGAWTGNTILTLFEGGNGVSFEADALGTTTRRRYRFYPRNTNGPITQTHDNDATITLSTDVGNPTGTASNGTLTVYLTYTTYDEDNIIYG